MNRIVNDFSRLPDSELLVFAEKIASSLTANAAFPTPAPDLNALNGTIEEFRLSLITAAGEGGHSVTIRKNANKEKLVLLLQKMANYVEFAAEGDELKMISSGFNLAKTHGSRPDITAPTNLALSDGTNSGGILLTFDRVPNAISYLYQYMEDPLGQPVNWKTKAGSSCECVFEGLEIGKRYWCRAGAVGAKGQTVYSNPLSRIVQ